LGGDGYVTLGLSGDISLSDEGRGGDDGQSVCDIFGPRCYILA